MSLLDRLPEVRGSLKADVSLAPYTWLRVGGAADAFFIPKDEADLALFLSSTDPEIPVTILGVASNTLVRDGGIEGVVIRLGPAFGSIETDGLTLTAGAAALDARVAKAAADAGIAGLEFYAGVPGTIGGALRMNAGCYGSETQDVLKELVAIDRRGRRIVMSIEDMGYSYRHSAVSDDLIFVSATFVGKPDAPDAIRARMDAITTRREESQPIRSKTGGSTFKNPDGYSAWKVIDAAGMRGHRVGGAQMSEQHCNFMINADNATAADLEGLGEAVRAKVLATQGISLDWEVRRIGRAE
ncbi:UDP-N-acetylenolpyruvoylglucosamine reductase [Algimonas ampicilliniresistens]|uniref:UDP-N-acetylenolpyruvoylglucosamine reductase n=1 Tax=Algimonas ampicilliniresistens TaxID=1298735 RepID=A0ABQ5V929_9PROT|nr:UDP-N-acetylmuramate dehydrogenase [Algimonas ampicilliniresistens]GLQ23547.1 UDP-N-acetylenolpyruvoylglucosamine reductase [Algimonas ampicilliniresistens]